MKASDVALVSELSLAVRVLAAPAVVGLTALKVATPPTAATVSVLPVKAVVPLAIVTLLVLLVTVLPKESCTMTVTAGLIAEPAVVVLG